MNDLLDRIAVELGDGATAIAIPSANPVNFHQVITTPEGCPPLEIDGVLALPAGSGPHPVVIVVPGSAGISPNHVLHARTLRDAGYGVCLVDPFGARSVSSTVANQAQYSFAASAFDVLAALATVANHPRVDPARISA